MSLGSYNIKFGILKTWFHSFKRCWKLKFNLFIMISFNCLVNLHFFKLLVLIYYWQKKRVSKFCNGLVCFWLCQSDPLFTNKSVIYTDNFLNLFKFDAFFYVFHEMTSLLAGYPLPRAKQKVFNERVVDFLTSFFF